MTVTCTINVSEEKIPLNVGSISFPTQRLPAIFCALSSLCFETEHYIEWSPAHFTVVISK